MSWPTLRDPSNPFNESGLSREVRAILDYLVAAKAHTGVDVVVTSTTDHPYRTASGNVSRHRMPGSGGAGLGLDCRLRRRGLDIHRPVFELFRPVALRCHELIYATAPANVKNEQWVSPYARSDHRDHVHCSVDLGVILVYPYRRPDPIPAPKFPVYHWTKNGVPMATERIRIELDGEGRGNEPTGYDAATLDSLEVWAPVRPNADGWYPGDPGRLNPQAWPFEDGGKLGIIVTGGPPNGYLDCQVSVRS